MLNIEARGTETGKKSAYPWKGSGRRDLYWDTLTSTANPYLGSGKEWILAPPLPVTQGHCMHLSSPGLVLPSDQVLNHWFKLWLSISTTDRRILIKINNTDWLQTPSSCWTRAYQVQYRFCCSSMVPAQHYQQLVLRVQWRVYLPKNHWAPNSGHWVIKIIT